MARYDSRKWTAVQHVDIAAPQSAALIVQFTADIRQHAARINHTRLLCAHKYFLLTYSFTYITELFSALTLFVEWQKVSSMLVSRTDSPWEYETEDNQRPADELQVCVAVLKTTDRRTDQADEEDASSSKSDSETTKKLSQSTRCRELLVTQRPTQTDRHTDRHADRQTDARTHTHKLSLPRHRRRLTTAIFLTTRINGNERWIRKRNTSKTLVDIAVRTTQM